MIDLHPSSCNICGGETEYISNAGIYGKEYGSGKCYRHRRRDERRTPAKDGPYDDYISDIKAVLHFGGRYRQRPDGAERRRLAT
jgi:hypothetical protein